MTHTPPPPDKPNRTLTLVLGGARSGKSRQAEALVTAAPPPWIYIATAQAFDDEMRLRIEAHRANRLPGWRTVESPLELAATLARESATRAPLQVDCLTLWLSNLMLAGRNIETESNSLLSVLAGLGVPTVIVSNEVGLGIVPDNALARAFRDHQGRLNQQVAALAGRVVLMAAGLPLTLKGPPL